jgi:hypothetical protein
MPSKLSTNKSSGSLKIEKNSRAAWLKSLTRGDKVWVASLDFFEELESPKEISSLFKQEEFDSFYGKDRAILKCDYDGGFWVKLKNIFPSKKSAKNHLAGEIIAAIKKKRRKLLGELFKWSDLQHEYEDLLYPIQPIVGKASSNPPKLPKTCETVNGQKF